MVFPGDWGHYFEVTVQSGQVSGSHSDFPIYFPLSNAPSGFWGKVKSDGGDIRVSDTNENLVPHEVSYIDTGSQKGSLWLKPSNIDDQSNKTLRVYYDNPNVSALPTTDANGRNSVWSNGYRAAWHFASIPPNNLVDVTGNGHDGDTSSLSSAQSQIGTLGKYIRFFGNNSVTVPNDPAITPFVGWGKSLWVRANGDVQSSDYDNVGATGIWSNGGNSEILWTGTDNQLNWFIALVTSTGRLDVESSNPRDNEWHLIRWQYETDNILRLYIDGSLAGESSNGGDPAISTANLALGSYAWGNNGSAGKFDISECQIGNARNQNWISTEYANQNDPSTFFAVGSEQGLAFQVDPAPITSGKPKLGELSASIRSDLELSQITAGTPTLPTIQAAATKLSLRRISEVGGNAISITSGSNDATLTGRTSNRAEITNG